MTSRTAPDGLRRDQLLEAQRELDRDFTQEAAEDATTFAVLLWDWTTAEHRREALRVQHQRTAELKRRGRRTDPDPLVTQYAQVKEELELVVEQLVELLESLDPQRATLLLAGQHLLPGMGVTLRAPAALVATLTGLLQRRRGNSSSGQETSPAGD